MQTSLRAGNSMDNGWYLDSYHQSLSFEGGRGEVRPLNTRRTRKKTKQEKVGKSNWKPQNIFVKFITLKQIS